MNCARILSSRWSLEILSLTFSELSVLRFHRKIISSLSRACKEHVLALKPSSAYLPALLQSSSYQSFLISSSTTSTSRNNSLTSQGTDDYPSCRCQDRPPRVALINCLSTLPVKRPSQVLQRCGLQPARKRTSIGLISWATFTVVLTGAKTRASRGS
jgi:hypothetical protein